MNINDYCEDLDATLFGMDERSSPWDIVEQLDDIVSQLVTTLDESYEILDGVAIHESARVDTTAQIQGPAVIGPNCFIGPHVLIRGGVLLANSVSVGPSCEIKRSIIGKNTALAHFNFVGDSILGAHVNLEAGAILANYYNEREDKTIYVQADNVRIDTGTTKFGALIGDNSRLGANSVTSPGTLLSSGSVVRRLELIEQNLSL